MVAMVVLSDAMSVKGPATILRRIVSSNQFTGGSKLLGILRLGTPLGVPLLAEASRYHGESLTIEK
jgi:hypothetical protein